MRSSTRCAIYARFSDERQNERSAEDQVRDCRRRAELEGWEVVAVYTDEAISGASNRRPGMTALLAAAANGDFNLVLAEDQDRLTRDLEDAAAFYKRLSFHDVQLFTLANGRVDELQIGFKGTMDMVELKKLGEKVRRGQRGSLERGKVPGGLCYGYDIVRGFDDRGHALAGVRTVNQAQAAVVVRIFEGVAADRSPRAIAKELNAEGLRSPRGGEWRASTIIGNRGRQVGILHNRIYVGEFVYGRVAGRRDPETRNRVWRTTAGDDRRVYELPELRIVSDDLWQRAHAAIEARSGPVLVGRRRPRRLLSGLVKCGACGGNFTVFANDRLCCSRMREAGTCGNRVTVLMADVERRVLGGLRNELLSAEAVSLMVREYHLERDRQLREQGRSRKGLEQRLRRAEAAVANLVAAIADGGGAFAELRQALAERAAERESARSELAELEAPNTIALHPHIADAYRARIERLTDGDVADMSDAQKAEVRALVDSIRVTPADNADGKTIEIVGSLEAAIAVASGAQLPRRGTLSVMLVAGDRSRHNRHRRSIMI